MWLVFAIYTLLLTEGALRKWLLPGQQQLLFFVKDPLVLLAYAVATLGGLWPRPNVFFVLGLGFTVGGGALALVQSMLNSGGALGIIIAGYGWRSYFLYLPLAFLIAEHMRSAELWRIIRLTLLLAIPVAALVVLQHGAGQDSVINKGLLPGEGFSSMPVADGIIRPAGLFTASGGQNHFVMTCVAFLFAAWLSRAPGEAPRPLVLLAATGAVLVCIAVGGSRGAMIGAGIIALFVAFGGALVGNARLIIAGLALPTVLVGLLLVLAPILFPEASSAFADRWTGAYRSESRHFQFGIVGRALYGFYAFVYLIPDAPPLGWGMGMGGNAATMLGASADVPYAESGWSRHIVDLGPMFGTLFIAFRVVLTVWLGAVAVVATRLHGALLPLLLFAYTSPQLLLGQISGQGTIQVYVWLFFGFTLAAARFAGRQSVKPDAVPAPQRRRRLMQPRADGGRLGVAS